jgi:hypothetical protein
MFRSSSSSTDVMSHGPTARQRRHPEHLSTSDVTGTYRALEMALRPTVSDLCTAGHLHLDDDLEDTVVTVSLLDSQSQPLNP